MKKFARFLVATIFSLSIALAIINTATHEYVDGKNYVFATVIPIPPPPAPSQINNK